MPFLGAVAFVNTTYMVVAAPSGAASFVTNAIHSLSLLFGVGDIFVLTWYYVYQLRGREIGEVEIDALLIVGLDVTTEIA